MLRASSLSLAALFASSGALDAQTAPPPLDPSYRVETIATPAGLVPETGGICFTAAGDLAICFRRGEIWRAPMPEDPREAPRWTRFAHGLHEPLGLLPGRDARELLVAERPAITRVRDEDGDGTADFYEVVSEDFGISGNYHEYTFGPVRDAHGNLYFGLGCASDAKGIFDEPRGEVSAFGRKGRMYSAVPWRGWCLKITPEGKQVPFASGLREPNGFCFDLEGRLYCVDNQGDWLGTSKLHHVREGAFHGHVSSLVWDPEFPRDPLSVPVEELDRLRKREAISFPQGKLANSPTQPLCDTTNGAFGPYAGQLFSGCITYDRLLRIALEEVGGEMQGAAFPFLDGNGLRKGNNRLAWSPDGRMLYVGQTARGWGEGEGLQRVVFTGVPPFDVLRMQLVEDGFVLHFTQPVDRARAAESGRYALQRYHYLYHRPYGSDRMEEEPVAVESATVSDDGLRIHLRCPLVEAPKVYELHLRELVSARGVPLRTTSAYYTLNRRR
jgi:hypothetical protein